MASSVHSRRKILRAFLRLIHFAEPTVKFALQISVESNHSEYMKIAQQMLGNFHGTPSWVRTSDLRLRSPLLYPAELSGRVYSIANLLLFARSAWWNRCRLIFEFWMHRECHSLWRYSYFRLNVAQLFFVWGLYLDTIKSRNFSLWTIDLNTALGRSKNHGLIWHVLLHHSPFRWSRCLIAHKSLRQDRREGWVSVW